MSGNTLKDRIKIMRWMSGNTLRDRTRNECIHRKLEVALIRAKIKKN